MTCRQAFELDLPAFLADSREARFAGFVDHYPRCPECSAEIRAWTELDEKLRRSTTAPAATHPEPELLVRFDAEPASLGHSQRTSIEAHLSGCITCRDELAALRTFVQDGPPIATLARDVAPAPRRSGLASLLVGLRGIVWQPAFAYALLALALVPTIYRNVDPGATARPMLLQDAEQGERVASVRRKLAAKRVQPRQDERLARALTITRFDETRLPELEDTRVSDAADARTFEPYDARIFEPLADHSLAFEELGRLGSLGYLEFSEEAEIQADSDTIASAAASELSKPSPLAIASAPTSVREFEDRGESAFAAAALGFSAAGPREAAIQEKTARGRTLAQRSMLNNMAFARTGTEIAGLSLDPDTARHAPSEVLETGLLLHIPLARPALEPRLVEVRIFAPDGERELVERHNLLANRASLESRLPAAWLTPGEYRVRVVVENEEPAEFLFSVRAPTGD